jgi:hypothetical protein
MRKTKTGRERRKKVNRKEEKKQGRTEPRCSEGERSSYRITKVWD